MADEGSHDHSQSPGDLEVRFFGASAVFNCDFHMASSLSTRREPFGCLYQVLQALDFSLQDLPAQTGQLISLSSPNGAIRLIISPGAFDPACFTKPF
jgi:hypothetical protein